MSPRTLAHWLALFSSKHRISWRRREPHGSRYLRVVNSSDLFSVSPFAVTGSAYFLETEKASDAMLTALYREHSPVWSVRRSSLHVVLKVHSIVDSCSWI